MKLGSDSYERLLASRVLSRADIEAAQAKLAKIMITHNRPQFGPILERLAEELEAMPEDPMIVAQRLLGK